MLHVVPEGDSFYKLVGMPSRATTWLRYEAPQEYRYYEFEDKVGCWFVHRDYLLGVVEVSYRQQGAVDYSRVSIDLQIEIAKAKENWTVYARRTGLAPVANLSVSYNALHLLPSAPMSVVQATWHALAKEHHPDKGGNPEEFKKYSEAYHAIRKEDT
jgi:hypothetical protein